MTTKTQHTQPTSPGCLYEAEDLDPEGIRAAGAETDSFLEHNKDAINASIDRSRVEFERGEYFTIEEVMAKIEAQRLRRRASKP